MTFRAVAAAPQAIHHRGMAGLTLGGARWWITAIKVVVILAFAVAAMLAAGIFVLGLLVVLIGPQPPRAQRTLVPELIGVVVRWDHVEGACAVDRFTLESGDTLDVRWFPNNVRSKCGEGPWETGTPRLSASTFSLGTADPGESVANGGLVYYGHDEQGEQWIAGAYSNASADSDGCPYRLQGSGHEEGPILHFSNGLVVEKAPGLGVLTDWVTRPGVFQDGDTICVNREGQAVSLQRYPNN